MGIMGVFPASMVCMYMNATLLYSIAYISNYIDIQIKGTNVVHA
jgi:hypothetical protein